MKLFKCQACQQILYFENTVCVKSQHRLGSFPMRQRRSRKPTQLEPESYAAGQTGLRLRLAGRNQGRTARALKRCRAKMGLQRMGVDLRFRKEVMHAQSRSVHPSQPTRRGDLVTGGDSTVKLADLPARDIWLLECRGSLALSSRDALRGSAGS
jgi:hypothetical protein